MSRAASQTASSLRLLRFAVATVGWLLKAGMPMGPLRMLTTTGRRTGLPRSTPVAVTPYDGNLFLVSPFGETDWVKNVRYDPIVWLSANKITKTVLLKEVGMDGAAPVLQVFRRNYRRIPFVPPAFEARANGELADFRAEASRHPVFLVASVETAQPAV